MANLQIAQQGSLKLVIPQEAVRMITGAALLVGSTFVPFLLTFNIAGSIGLNHTQLPDTATPAAVAGLILVVLSMVLTPRLRKLPADRIAALVSPILAVLGVLTSLTM